MCFGERTTFTCPISVCQNKSWETKWYNFGAENGMCPMGNPAGSCPDPYMTYLQEKKYCVTCLLLFSEEQTSQSPPPETYHPDDHNHEQPQILHYDASEQQTLKSTGELTMPMVVARELNNQEGGTTIFQAGVSEHGLMGEINNIVANRNLDWGIPDPGRGLAGSITTTSRNHTDDVDDEDRSIFEPPTTPVRTLPFSEVPEQIFEGQIPQTALNDTPLPTYDQAATRGQAPVYDQIDPDDIPMNRHTLARVALYAHGMSDAYRDVLEGRLTKLSISASSPTTRMPEVVDHLKRLCDAWKYLSDEAEYRDQTLFKNSTCSATREQVFDWIAEITRNPANSVQHHARRFSQWLCMLEEDYSTAVVSGVFAGPLYRPFRREVNLTFEQQEVRDQVAMLGSAWTGTPEVRPTAQNKKIMTDNMLRTRWFPTFYDVDDEDDEDYGDDFDLPHPSIPYIYVDLPDDFGIPDPIDSDNAADMMDVD
jgi:hypothetical protein